MLNPRTTFDRWFVQPLAKLKEIPNGDGGFVALATSCFLYERYAVSTIKKSGRKATDDEKIKQLISDFGIDQVTAEAFWDVIRNGILHQAMPKAREHGSKIMPSWVFHNDFDRPIELGTSLGQPILKVQT